MKAQARLVKGSDRRAEVKAPAPQVNFTNWAFQFRAEYEAEKANRPTPRAQWRDLFRTEVQ